MEKQEIFDKVALHLVWQNSKAMRTFYVSESNTDELQQICAYWDKKTNKKCAIGCLIPEAKYNDFMEKQGSIMSNTMVRDVLQSIGIPVISSREIDEFIAALQYIHDYNDVEAWKRELRICAIANGLNIPTFILES